MTSLAAKPVQGFRGPGRILTLVGLFWAFSYVLLSIRGALFHDDWSRLVDNNRLLAVSVGAGAYGLVLKQLQGGVRVTFGRALSWIVLATLIVAVVRLSVDELLFDVPQGLSVNLLFSLTWSAYFALWVMASLAFVPHAPVAEAPVPAQPVARALTGSVAKAANVDSFELLLAAIVAEAGELNGRDRADLATRVLALGGYESPEASARDNERAQLALRLAARLSDGGA